MRVLLNEFRLSIGVGGLTCLGFGCTGGALTFTDCVAAASAIPLNVTDAGLVVLAYPPVVGRLVVTVRLGDGVVVPPAN